MDLKLAALIGGVAATVCAALRDAGSAHAGTVAATP